MQASPYRRRSLKDGQVMASKYVIARFSTWVSPTIHINFGEIWDAEDPVVRSHPDWFDEDPDDYARRSAPKYVKTEHGEEKLQSPKKPVEKKTEEKPVEQATAAPGEKRTTHRA